MDKSRFVSEGTSSLKRERAILFEEKTSFVKKNKLGMGCFKQLNMFSPQDSQFTRELLQGDNCLWNLVSRG